VTFHLYSNQTCTGTPTDEGPITLDSSGNASSSGTTVPSTGLCYTATYNDDATYNGNITSAIEPLTAIPNELTAIAPTQTTCEQFLTTSFTPISRIDYGLKQGTINNVSPGVFFFYASYILSSSQPSLTVDAQETFNSAATTIPDANRTNDFVVTNGQAFLYSVSSGTCTKLSSNITTTISPSSTNGGQVTITYSPSGGVPAGTYVLGIKYTNSSSLIGSAPCHGAGPSCNYFFTPSRDGTVLTSRARSFAFKKRGSP
jgi:hypothetical protein